MKFRVCVCVNTHPCVYVPGVYGVRWGTDRTFHERGDRLAPPVPLQEPIYYIDVGLANVYRGAVDGVHRISRKK